MEMDSKTRFLEDTLSLVLCRLCGILHCSLCTGFPEGPCTCGPNMFGRCRCGLRSCEWALGRKSQQGIQTCCQSLQALLYMDQMVRERFLFWVDFSLELRVMRWEWAHVSTVLSGFSFWLFWACWWRGSSWTRDTVPSSLSPLGVFACWLCLYSSCQHTGQRWVLPSVTEWLFLLPCRRQFQKIPGLFISGLISDEFCWDYG